MQALVVGTGQVIAQHNSI